MSETAKRHELLEEETTRFIQALVAEAVEPPIERFRESATRALEGPAAGLTEAREALVRATGELAARTGSKLDSLQGILEEALEDLPRQKDLGKGFEGLRKEGEERKRLLEGVLEALARLSVATTSGLEALAQPLGRIETAAQETRLAVGTDLSRRLEEGLGALDSKLARPREAQPSGGPAELPDFQRVKSVTFRRVTGSRSGDHVEIPDLQEEIATLRASIAKEFAPVAVRLGEMQARLENGISFLQERSQASMEHFRLLATQIRDLRADVATLQSQVRSRPPAPVPAPVPVETPDREARAVEMAALEERLAGQMRAEAGRVRRTVLLSGGILFLSLLMVLLAVLGGSP